MKLKQRQIIGVFLTSLAVLTLQVSLTRIFSVTMWYHFAFMAISMALMGSAAAGVVLYFFPSLTEPQRAEKVVGVFAASLALVVPLIFILYLNIPFRVSMNRLSVPVDQLLHLVLIYVLLTIPFFFSGLVLVVALSAWSEEAGRLYWADLTGASLGCLFSIVALEALGGTGAVLVAGTIASFAAVAFTWQGGRRWIFAGLVSVLLLALLFTNIQWNWLQITVNKAGGEEPDRAYERWNAHSRVTVYDEVCYPFFWSVAHERWQETMDGDYTFCHALLLIDAVAGTPIQQFDGNLDRVAFLRYDLTSFVYHLIDGPKTLVIGPGGGRDVLAALATDAPHVTAVEVNPAVIDAVRGPFADFAGRLYERPDVTVEVADARGYIARSPERYDVIQASLIDTWAAGGSGAFALSENSLYTVEAFETYYDHLTDDGILTVSRWYLSERPAETMRLLSTGMEGWERSGVDDPRLNVAVVAKPNTPGQPEGLATALFKRTAFTRAEVERMEQRAEDLGFTVLYAPGLEPWEAVGEFVATEDRERAIADFPLDISPATDNRPFFFNIVRFGDLFDPAVSGSGVYQTSIEAIVILLVVLGVTAGLGVLFIILPLWLGGKRRGLTLPPGALLGYFALLGVTFMVVETPTIQRFTVYLGRPVYSLAVVLFSLLFFSGFGSLWISHRLKLGEIGSVRRIFIALVVMVIFQSFLAVPILRNTVRWAFPARLALSVGLLAPLGLLMGIPFPLGLRWAGKHHSGSIPWLWGINGVMSVLGSALGTALAIHVGFTITLGIAALLYGLAGVLLVRQMGKVGGASPVLSA